MQSRAVAVLVALAAALVACAADPPDDEGSASAASPSEGVPADADDPSADTEDPGDGVDGDGSEDDDPAADEAALAAVAAEEAPAPTVSDELDEDAVPITAAPPAIPDGSTPTTPTSASAAVVYLNFGGPIVRTCAEFCNDSSKNRSTMIKTVFGKSALDFRPYTNTTRRKAVVAAVRRYFSAYNVVVTTRRPTSGAYTMAVISPSRVGPTSRRGTSYLDCNNAMKRDIVFVYRIGAASAGTIARYVTHEVGHSLGLMHVTSTTDLMQYASSGKHWTNATLDTARNPPGYTCLPGKTRQDAPALLRAALGPKP